jgi:hypothetical protein
MKKATVIGIALYGFLGLAVRINAAPQEGGAAIKQKVTKTAKRTASQTKVVYRGSPQFASIDGTSITYATNTSETVLNLGDVFFLNSQNVWLVSESAQGPWVAARSIPQKVTAIVCGQINANPFEPYQLCTVPWRA